MIEPAILETLAAQDAAEALIALGWPIMPYGADLNGWLVGGTFMTEESLALAKLQGIHPAHEQVQ